MTIFSLYIQGAAISFLSCLVGDFCRGFIRRKYNRDFLNNFIDGLFTVVDGFIESVLAAILWPIGVLRILYLCFVYVVGKF